STSTAIRRPEPPPARRRCGRRGFKNASRCRRSRARASDRVVRLRTFLDGRASRDDCGLTNGRGIHRIAVSGWWRSAFRPLPFPISFSEAIMKAILSMALALGLCGLAGAADKVEPVGTWKCEYEIG